MELCYHIWDKAQGSMGGGIEGNPNSQERSTVLFEVTSTKGIHSTHKTYGVCNLLLCSGLLFSILVGFVCAAAGGDSALPEAFRSEDLLWEIRLGNHQYTIPRIDRGRVFIGINDRGLEHPVLKSTGGGILMCLEQSSGKMIWQLVIPRYMEGIRAPYHFNQWKCGVCSRPVVDGNRLYIVGPRGEVLCIDREGQSDGNQGPFLNEIEYMGIPAGSDYKLAKTDGDIIWRYDMIKGISVVPHDVCGSTPLLYGDFLYVCTSNGVDDRHDKVANPLAPSLIVLDKQTGRLAATDGELIGKRLLHGHWSSPVLAEAEGRVQIIFGGGNGVLYAFEALESSGDKTTVGTLKKIWEYDCNPADYRSRNGRSIPYASWNRKSPDGPSEIIATPVVYKGRVYVSIGQSPLHGAGQGMLSCIDAASGKRIWESRRVDRSLSDVVIDDGLLYISDFSGRLHCLNADTGEHYWQHELGAGMWSASPVVVGEKVYISTEHNVLWVLKASRIKEEISRCRLQSMAITATVDDGVLYLPTQKRLFALRITSDVSPMSK